MSVEQATSDRQVQQVAPTQPLGLDLHATRAVMLEDHIRWIDGTLVIVRHPDRRLKGAHPDHPIPTWDATAELAR